MSKRKSLKISISAPTKKGGMPFMEIPPEVADFFLEEGERKKRMVITFDNGKKFHRALQRNKDGFSYIVFGKSTLRQAKKVAGPEEEITLEIDNSEFGMPMPEELQEVLRQDEEGEKRFLELKPGMRRSFLYYINTGKTVDTRINRSLKLIDNLKNGIISAGTHTR